MIRFAQLVTNDTNLSIDAEKGETTIVDISGREVYLYKMDNLIYSMWIEDTYLLEVVCRGTFTEENVIDIIENIN